MRDVRDGGSQTLAMSERVSASVPAVRDRIYHIAVGSAFDPEPDDFRHLSEQITGNVGSLSFTRDVGTKIIGRGSLEHTHFNAVLSPNPRSVDIRHKEIVDLAVASARSYHADLVMALFLDGRVSPVDGSIDLAIWRKMAAVNDAVSVP